MFGFTFILGIFSLSFPHLFFDEALYPLFVCSEHHLALFYFLLGGVVLIPKQLVWSFMFLRTRTNISSWRILCDSETVIKLGVKSMIALHVFR